MLHKNSKRLTTRSHRQPRSFIAKQDGDYYVGIKYKHVEICCACTKQETGHVEMAHWSRILKRVDVEEKEEKMYKKRKFWKTHNVG